MRFDNFSFGSLRIDDSTYEHDVVIDRGEIRDRKKKPSKKFRDDFGHTPLSIAEDIPWKCCQLVIGYWCIRQIAGDERSRARGKASQGQIADFSDNQSDQALARRPRRYQRDVDCSRPLTPLPFDIILPANRDQLPPAIRRRGLLSQDVEIAIISADLVGDALRLAPLNQHSLNLIQHSTKPEPNGALIGLPAGVALHNQLHYRRKP